MGYITPDDDIFIWEFWDRSWVPKEPHPGYAEFMRRRVDAYRQVDLARVTLPFIRAIDEQLREIRRLVGSHPRLGLTYPFIAAEIKDSVGPITTAWGRAYRGLATGEDTRRLRRFLVRCWEAWLRWGWEWPWIVTPPAGEEKEGAEAVRKDILALKREVELRRLPPPREALPR